MASVVAEKFGIKSPKGSEWNRSKVRNRITEKSEDVKNLGFLRENGQSAQSLQKC